MKYPILLCVLVSAPAMSNNSQTLSCSEQGSDPYQYAATFNEQSYSFRENHAGNITSGTSEVISIERKADYIKIITKEDGAISSGKTVYELKGNVLTANTVTAMNGEIIYSGGGQMSNACVLF